MATNTKVSIINLDGTMTWLIGGFSVSGGKVTGGTINTMLRTNGMVTYESITGLSLDALVFMKARDKFALVFAGGDRSTATADMTGSMAMPVPT